MYIYIYIYIYTCVVCVYIYIWGHAGNSQTKHMDFQRASLEEILDSKGWNSHKESRRSSDSATISLRILSLRIDRIPGCKRSSQTYMCPKNVYTPCHHLNDGCCLICCSVLKSHVFVTTCLRAYIWYHCLFDHGCTCWTFQYCLEKRQAR